MKNLRHGLGTYFYASTGTKFMGSWVKDRMHGPGQLVHSRHRYHGYWELNVVFDGTVVRILTGDELLCTFVALRTRMFRV